MKTDEEIKIDKIREQAKQEERERIINIINKHIGYDDTVDECLKEILEETKQPKEKEEWKKNLKKQ